MEDDYLTTLRKLLDISESLRKIYENLRAMGMIDQADRYLRLGTDVSARIADHMRTQKQSSVHDAVYDAVGEAVGAKVVN